MIEYIYSSLLVMNKFPISNIPNMLANIYNFFLYLTIFVYYLYIQSFMNLSFFLSPNFSAHFTIYSITDVIKRLYFLFCIFLLNDKNNAFCMRNLVISSSDIIMDCFGVLASRPRLKCRGRYQCNGTLILRQTKIWLLKWLTLLIFGKKFSKLLWIF